MMSVLANICRWLTTEPEVIPYNTEVTITEGIHKGMYGRVASKDGDRYLIKIPEQDGKPWANEWFHQWEFETKQK